MDGETVKREIAAKEKEKGKNCESKRRKVKREVEEKKKKEI